MNAIATLAYKLPDWSQLTINRMAEYAKRINVEFCLLSPKEYAGFLCRGPLFKQVLLQYDRVCFIDADCVVSKNAPDIFEHEAGVVWMAPDAPYGDDACTSRFSDMLIMQTVCGSISWFQGYGNFGVTLVDRMHAEAFDGWLPIPDVHNDQANFNYLIRKFGYQCGFMDRRWNRMGISVGLPNSFESVEVIAKDAFIAHAAGFNKHVSETEIMGSDYPQKNRDRAIRKFDELLS